jgi:hypothetical protein
MTALTYHTGSFPLTGVAGLPNVTVAFPGEHWSNRKASGAIVPGEAVVPVNSGGKLYMRTAGSADVITQLAIALRPIDPPDPNVGPASLGPNEIVNQAIASQEYVHAYYSGVFHLTLVVPATYVPGDLIGWDADGARPVGKSGTGAWAKNAAADIDSMFEVMEFRELDSGTHTGILTVRSLRGQF